MSKSRIVSTMATSALWLLLMGSVGAQCASAFREDFETAVRAPGTPGCLAFNPGEFPAGWSNDPGNLTAWRVYFGATFSGGTGPSGDHGSGTGNYVYVETSCPPGTYVSILNMPCLDSTGMTGPVLGFHHHMYGAAMGTLEVQTRLPGSGWQTAWSLGGDQGDVWNRVEVPLPAGEPNLETRFVYTRGNGLTGDCALDDVFFGERRWQTNSGPASLRLEGKEGDAFFPHREVACLQKTVEVVLDSTLATPVWELVVEAAPAKPSPATTPGGQRINVGLAGLYLNAGFSGANAFPVALPVASAVPVLLNAQLAVLDASAPEGYVLSAPAEFEARAAAPLPQTYTAPATSDGNVTVPVGCVPFYGRSYERLFVSTNGRITFGGADTTFGPVTATDFLGDRPCFGYWADLDPSLGGSITVSSPGAGVYEVHYSGVPYFGQPGTSNSFTLRLDGDQLVIDGLAGIDVNAGAPGTVRTAWVGVSAGQPLASDAGATPFAPGNAYSSPSPYSALYAFGDAGTLASGVASLLFLPAAGGGYQLFAL